MVTDGGDPEFNEDDKYNEFPISAEYGFGPAEGFNTWVRLNDRALFTEEALQNPTIAAFCDAPIAFNYAQFKSSYRESEWFIHKPALAMTGRAPGIEGSVDQFPVDRPRIPTLVINHDRTLAKKITRSVTVADGDTAGQIIYKEPEE